MSIRAGRFRLGASSAIAFSRLEPGAIQALFGDDSYDAHAGSVTR